MADLVPVQSTNIRGVGYDPSTQQMAVQFNSGGTYMHYGVTPEAHAAFMGSQSKGAHYHEKIRGAFRSEKLSEMTGPKK